MSKPLTIDDFKPGDSFEACGWRYTLTGERLVQLRAERDGCRTFIEAFPAATVDNWLESGAVRDIQSKERGPARLYAASKVKHADMWRGFRDIWGAPIISTWIDEAEEGQTADYRELAQRCIREVQSATAVILYCQPGEVLKGALLEVGAALAFGIPVYCVGNCDSLSRIFTQHPDWHTSETVSGAVSAAHSEWRACA